VHKAYPLCVQASDQKFTTGYLRHHSSPFISGYEIGNFDLEIGNFFDAHGRTTHRR
jgi:hypothetical protein